MSTKFQAIRFEQDHGIATITLNRPDKLNAIDAVMRRELWSAVEKVAFDPTARVLIIAAEGRAFSAGGDLEIFERTFEETSGFRGDVSQFTRTFDLLEAMEKPVIAAVNGICTGAGLQLTLSCDLRIAAESAAFAFFENNIGLLPAAGGCSRLVKLIGYGRAKELVLLGEKTSAAAAERIGLVNQVVADSQLKSHVDRMARKFLTMAPEALGLAKRVLHGSINADLETGRLLEALGQSILVKTKNHKEGIKAFREKRKPKFD